MDVESQRKLELAGEERGMLETVVVEAADDRRPRGVGRVVLANDHDVDGIGDRHV